VDLGLAGRVSPVCGSSAGLGLAVATRLTTPEANQSRQVGTIPLGRKGEPEELASVGTFLASERASHVTGAVLAVDGGHLRSID
jgi:NAD(P)-dependent dehydrogenase (short-subunit alcohol dehydrogenase family)